MKMNEHVLVSICIPVNADAAGCYEERQAAIARWCKPNLPDVKAVPQVKAGTTTPVDKHQMPSPPPAGGLEKSVTIEQQVPRPGKAVDEAMGANMPRRVPGARAFFDP